MAIVTPSYGPDLARCELLVESVRRLARGAHHYIIADKRDRDRFAHLAGPGTSLITSETLLPRGTRRLPGDTSIWVSPTHRPTRGWMVQQVLKLAIAQVVDQEVIVYTDSDTCFIRPFGIDDVSIGGAVGLLDVGFRSEEVERWTNVACGLLGLDPRSVPVRGHVGNAVCWRREHALSLCRHIETQARRDWRTTLLRLPTVSEYIVYGVYIRAVLGYPASGHAPSTVPLVKGSWGQDLSNPQVLDQFFADLDPRTIAVMVHSKDGIPVDAYRDRVMAFWSSAR